MNQWKEYRRKFHDRAVRIVERMTLDEKIRLMSGSASWEEAQGAIRGQFVRHYNETPNQAGGNGRLGVPALSFVDGTRGVVCGRGIFTCFPVSLLRGATFDRELERKIGIAVAEEVRYAGGNFFGGVCVNLPYHPGWGRMQEAYGEDGCLISGMASALIGGVQSRGVIACVKHYAFHSMENVRHSVNIICDKRTEREVMLPHFQSCVEAGAGAVMCAYNFYQGDKCGQSSYLIRDILKGEWGFDGIVISDFTWGITDTKKAAEAGMDVEMPNTFYYGDRLKALVQNQELPERTVDEAAVRIVRTVLAHQARGGRTKPADQDFAKHRKLAFQCAAEGITLLKNERGLLPLKAKKKRIAVLGGLASLELTGDRGSSRVYPPYVVTPLQGIVRSAAGAEVTYYGGTDPAHAGWLAGRADYVILVLGNDYASEGECIETDRKNRKHMGGDREAGLALGAGDQALLDAVTAVRDDAVVVLSGGGMILMEDWCEKVGAILLLYYAGMEGGAALGQILFGRVNPSGKLPFTIVRDENDLPKIDWQASQQRYGYYHGYTLLEKNGRRPRYPFGYGLSYTSFRLSGHRAWHSGGVLYASVTVKNTGARSGAEVVQLYVGVPDSAVERPRKLLKDFQKVRLKAGEEKDVTLSCPAAELAYYEEKSGAFVREYGEYAVYLGTSSAPEDLVVLRVMVPDCNLTE